MSALYRRSKLTPLRKNVPNEISHKCLRCRKNLDVCVAEENLGEEL